MLPIEVLRTKAQQYVTEGLLQEDTAHRIIQVIEGERNAEILLNDGEDEETPLASKMSSRELQAELAKREGLMKGDGSAGSDQWRCYQHIVGKIQRGGYLRLMIQACCFACVYCYLIRERMRFEFCVSSITRRPQGQARVSCWRPSSRGASFTARRWATVFSPLETLHRAYR